MASQSILGKESTVDLLSSGILQTLVDLNFMILEFFFQMCKHSTKLFRSEDSKQDFQAPTTATGGQRFNLGPWHQPVEIYLGSASTAAEAENSCGSTDSPLSQVGLRGDINYLLNLVML